jgi:hypothetical protein
MMIAQKPLEAHEKKPVIFQEYVLKLRKQQEYLLGQIGNAGFIKFYFYFYFPISEE